MPLPTITTSARIPLASLMSPSFRGPPAERAATHAGRLGEARRLPGETPWIPGRLGTSVAHDFAGVEELHDPARLRFDSCVRQRCNERLRIEPITRAYEPHQCIAAELTLEL